MPGRPSLKPAAAYLRRSTDRQEASLQDQRREILRYAMEQGFAVVAEFVDDGVSGTSGETRKGFLAMVAEAQSRARAWNTILVWDIKRFGRMSSDEVGYYRWMLKQAGVEIIFTSEGFTGTSADKFLRFFKQEAAREESASLSKAVIRGMVGLADEGWWTGGQAPFGYDLGYFDSVGKLFQIVRHTDSGEKVILNPDGSLLRTVDRGHKAKASRSEHVRLLRSLPERVDLLRQIFAWYTGPHSMGFKAIADRLNREGVASARGKGWSLSSVRAILTNQVYTGRLVWNVRQMGKFHRVADRREVERDGCGKRRVQRNAHQDWLVHENAHDALIDQVTFERAQRLMKERGDRATSAGFLTGTAKVSRYLLSGLLRCGECGGSMFGQTQWKKKPRKDGSRIGTGYYICGASVMKGRSVCQPVRFLQNRLDDYVADLIGRRLSSLLGASGRATLRKLVERELKSEGQDPRPEIHRLRARLEENAKKADAVIDLATTSQEHRELLNDRLARLRAERREIESRLQELESRSHEPITDPDLVVDAVLEGLQDARRLFTHGTMEERKRVVRTFVEGLTLSASKRSGELLIKKLPTPQSLSAGSSVDSLAGVRCGVGQGALAERLELVVLPLQSRGTALTPARRTPDLLQSVM